MTRGQRPLALAFGLVMAVTLAVAVALRPPGDEPVTVLSTSPPTSSTSPLPDVVTTTSIPSTTTTSAVAPAPKPTTPTTVRQATTTTRAPTTATTARPATTSTSRPPPPAANTASDALNLLNGDRTSRGLPALRVRSDAQTKAQAWAEKLASENAHYHSTLSQGLDPCWTGVGENLAVAPTVAQAEQSLMNDPPHRDNVLGSRWNWVGVGVARSATGVVVVQVFVAGCT